MRIGVAKTHPKYSSDVDTAISRAVAEQSSFISFLQISHAQMAALVDALKSYDPSQMSSKSVEANRPTLSAAAAAQGSLI